MALAISTPTNTSPSAPRAIRIGFRFDLPLEAAAVPPPAGGGGGFALPVLDAAAAPAAAPVAAEAVGAVAEGLGAWVDDAAGAGAGSSRSVGAAVMPTV